MATAGQTPTDPRCSRTPASGPLTLFGRVTGVRYHFPGPGARVHVDARDAPSFEVVQGVEVVKELDDGTRDRDPGPGVGRACTFRSRVR